MNNENLTVTFQVRQSPEQVFAAINDVRGWWSGTIEGETDRRGGEFTYRYKDIHSSTQTITELVPAERVVWHVTKSHIAFTKDPNEWTGTEMVFELAKKDGKTEVTFTHRGLVPGVECFDACQRGWTFYLTESLRKLLETGEGEPKEKDPRRTGVEVPSAAE